MFKNPGKKIKKVATVLFWLFAVPIALASVIFLAIGMGMELMDPLLAFVLFLLGTPLALFCLWFAHLLLYGFGELIDNTSNKESET